MLKMGNVADFLNVASMGYKRISEQEEKIIGSM